jgi:hypothetical protein
MMTRSGTTRRIAMDRVIVKRSIEKCEDKKRRGL